jgi:hypothetical protein
MSILKSETATETKIRRSKLKNADFWISSQTTHKIKKGKAEHSLVFNSVNDN